MSHLRSLNCFLGLVVTRYHYDMFLCQEKYAKEILEQAKILNYKPARTSVDTSTKVDGFVHLITDPTLCNSFTCSLQYHDCQTHPFICLRYLGSQFTSICFTFTSNFDADWDGFPTTHQSTSNYYVFIRKNLLSWSSKIQGIISWLSVEVDYMGIMNVIFEIIWL